jgi:hypothetical protein
MAAAANGWFKSQILSVPHRKQSLGLKAAAAQLFALKKRAERRNFQMNLPATDHRVFGKGRRKKGFAERHPGGEAQRCDQEVLEGRQRRLEGENPMARGSSYMELK